MCFVWALSGFAKRLAPKAAATAIKADFMIPRLCTRAPSGELVARQQPGLRRHVAGHAHHEQLEWLGTRVGEPAGFADPDRDGVARTDRRGFRRRALDRDGAG